MSFVEDEQKRVLKEAEELAAQILQRENDWAASILEEKQPYKPWVNPVGYEWKRHDTLPDSFKYCPRLLYQVWEYPLKVPVKVVQGMSPYSGLFCEVVKENEPIRKGNNKALVDLVVQAKPVGQSVKLLWILHQPTPKTYSGGRVE